jgi:competence protein ComFB
LDIAPARAGGAAEPSPSYARDGGVQRQAWNTAAEGGLPGAGYASVASTVSVAPAAGVTGGEARAAEDVPDGVPYENSDDEPLPNIFGNDPDFLISVRREEARRLKKIKVESALLADRKNLVNLSEMLAKELLPSVMDKMGVCGCALCTADVLALTLNSLPARYVTSDEGKQYTQLEVYKKQYELDVLSALTKACVRVKSSPRHEKPEE